MNILNVEGMRCEGCVKRVVEGLKEAGITAEVSLENKTVSFDGDDAVVKTAVEEIEDLGFEVISVAGK